MATYNRAEILARQTARKSERKEVCTRPMRTGEPIKPLQKVQKPIQRTPLKKSTKPIPKKSKKQLALEAIYYVLAKDFKKDHPKCEANLPGCTGKTTDIHHLESRGKNLNDVSKFKAVCRNCHRYIHDHPKEAMEKGLLLSKFKNKDVT